MLPEVADARTVYNIVVHIDAEDKSPRNEEGLDSCDRRSALKRHESFGKSWDSELFVMVAKGVGAERVAFQDTRRHPLLLQLCIGVQKFIRIFQFPMRKESSLLHVMNLGRVFQGKFARIGIDRPDGACKEWKLGECNLKCAGESVNSGFGVSVIREREELEGLDIDACGVLIQNGQMKRVLGHSGYHLCV